MESEKNEKKQTYWYLKALGVVLATAIVLWAIAIIAAKCFDFYISTDSAVSTIIGIVAGIIVIGNYAQVQDMKAELDKKIADVEKRQAENDALLSYTKSQVENFRIFTNAVDNLAQNGHTEIQNTES